MQFNTLQYHVTITLLLRNNPKGISLSISEAKTKDKSDQIPPFYLLYYPEKNNRGRERREKREERREKREERREEREREREREREIDR